jgi:hypothetical protein
MKSKYNNKPECTIFNVDYRFIDQIRRSILTRFKKRFSHKRNGNVMLSSVARYMRMRMKILGGQRICEHKLRVSNLKLLKRANNHNKLDAYESIFLYKYRKRKLINDERQKLGNIQSPRFQVGLIDRRNHSRLFKQFLKFVGLKIDTYSVSEVYCH